jgi:hypothetical protein
MKTAEWTLVMLLAAPLGAQDLFTRSKPALETKESFCSSDRSLPPVYRPTLSAGAEAHLGFEVEAALAWESFDFKRSFRSMFNRNVREEFLDQALSAVGREIAGSPMVLACQVSPTICETIKHYRQTANQMMAMDQTILQAVDGAVDDVASALHAKAVKDCLVQKGRQGVPLHDALRQCARAQAIRTLSGATTQSFELLEDICRTLKLSAEASALLKELGQCVEISPGGIRARVRLDFMGRAYVDSRRGFHASWSAAVEATLRGERLSAESLRKLAPSGAAPLTLEEVLEIAQLPEARRKVMLESLAGASALLDMTRKVHEVERALEAALYAADANPAAREALRRQRETLRAELDRLTEEYEHQERYTRAILTVEARAHAETQLKASLMLRGETRRREQRDHQRSGSSWGEPPHRTCNSCDVHPARTQGVRKP